MTRPTRTRFMLCLPAALAAGAMLLATPGCIIGAAIGGIADTYERTGTSDVPALYTGVEGKSFAIVTSGSRLIESEHPGLQSRITRRVNDRLIQNANPSYAIPSNDLLTVLYNTPQWPAMTRGEVAEMLGVERLITVEIIEYRLYEPGNQYIWDGMASALVSVYESDSGLPDDPVFDNAIQVTFPDSSGYMASDIPETAVTSELSNRLINRIAWIFYDHEESNIIPY